MFEFTKADGGKVKVNPLHVSHYEPADAKNTTTALFVGAQRLVVVGSYEQTDAALSKASASAKKK